MQNVEMTKATPEVQVVAGGPSTGKTTWLAAFAAGLPADSTLLALTPGHDAARFLVEAVEAKADELGVESPAVLASSVRGLALDILAEPAAARALGMAAAPRPMLEVECRLLLADLASSGHSSDAAKKAYAGLVATWDAGMWPEEANYDQSTPEALLLGWMKSRCAIPQRAVFAACVKALEADPDLKSRWVADRVVVDDANGLGRAAIKLCMAVAGTDIVFAGDPDWSPRFFDASADARAFAELACAQTHTLDQRHAHARLEHTVKWETLTDEVSGCCNAARNMLGRHGSQLRNHEAGPLVCAMSSKEWWLKSLLRQFEESRVQVRHLTATDIFMADIRKAASCSALRTFVVLGLAANREDEAVWRLACSLGRTDMGCAGWAELVKTARQKGCSVVEVLLDPATKSVFAATRDMFLGLVGKVSARRGTSLLLGIDGVDKGVLELCGGTDGDEEPAELFAKVCRLASDRRFCGRGDAWVGTPESLMGIQSECALVGGLNKTSAQSGGEVELAHAMSHGTVEAALCYARHCPPEVAEKLHLESSRTRTLNDAPQAVLKPDPAIARLGSLAPASVSGQQYRSAILGERS